MSAEDHRRICREVHGEYPRQWHVHHIDGDHFNNEPMNLIAMPAWLHNQMHGRCQSRHESLPGRKAIESMIGSHLLEKERSASRYTPYTYKHPSDLKLADREYVRLCVSNVLGTNYRPGDSDDVATRRRRSKDWRLFKASPERTGA